MRAGTRTSAPELVDNAARRPHHTARARRLGDAWQTVTARNVSRIRPDVPDQYI